MGPSRITRSLSPRALREAPEDMCNILFFGTIRPYKGLEDLVQAFELLASEDENCWLTVVGETWEDWTQPIEMIKASKYRDRITFVNHYVSDAEVSRWFAGADMVSLPIGAPLRAGRCI